jgi:hypothetical protein
MAVFGYISNYVPPHVARPGPAFTAVVITGSNRQPVTHKGLKPFIGKGKQIGRVVRSHKEKVLS